MGEIISIIFKNFGFIDFLIILLFVFNVFLFLRIRADAVKIHGAVYRKDYFGLLPDDTKKRLSKDRAVNAKEMPINDLFNIRENMNSKYAFFTNFTTMFPLMGMLGTVVSLIPMVDKMGEQSTGLFFTALTSTFWGIVAAILCKVLDAFISPVIDDIELYVRSAYDPDKINKGEDA